uniref:Vacuolar protein sorting-associated protein 11 homolog n=1 Tax=Panagrolaimus superbus TaxID=310955 RepID=A0A914YIW2_9BILA
MSVAELGWRRFQFFDKANVNDPKDSSKRFYGFKGLAIKCWRSSIRQPFVIFGEEKGVVFKLSPSLDIDFWKAYGRELVDLSLADEGNRFTIATLGADDVGNSSVLKVWDLNQWEKQSPICKISTKVTQNRKGATSTAVRIAIIPSCDFIAIGFADASILFSEGEITSEKSLKWKVLRDGPTTLGDGCLLGLHVTKAENDKTVVFVVCENAVLSFVLNGSNVLLKSVHDSNGAQPNCWYFNERINQLIVSNQEMVYFYDANRCSEDDTGAGRCHALGRGLKKKQIIGEGYYVGMVTEQESKLPGKSICMLTVYDVECRYIACTFPLNSSQLFTLNNDIYSLQEDGSMSRFTEKGTGAKLDIVIQKHLYDVAIALAKREKSSEISPIYFKYADYLYKRGDFQNAIQQYIETIGYLEPSHVIEKFIHGTRAVQLATYLEALHKRSAATENHTLLLLGAYLKMGSKDKVEDFVEKATHYNDLDVEEAVKLLRAGGYYEQASKMATAFNRVLLIFAILVEDLRSFDEAIAQLGQIEGKQFFEVLDAYGLTLLQYKEAEVIETVKKAVKSEETDVKVLVKLLNSHPKYLKILYEKAHDNVRRNVVLRNAVLEHTLERMKTSEQGIDQEAEDLIFELVDPSNYDNALRLGQLQSYSPLVIYVLRKQQRYDELLRYLLRDGEINDIIEECNNKMIKDLWIELITFLSKKKDLDEDYVVELLEKVTKANLVHPLVITNILSRNENLAVGCVKKYLEQWLATENEKIKENTKIIEENVKKSNELEKQIHIYDEDVQIFQALRCAVCDLPLQMPAVHFMCKHSYHSHCYESYSDQHDRCPACASTETETLMIQTKEQRTISIDELQSEIDTCGSTMAVIAKFIARGVFDGSTKSKTPRSKTLIKQTTLNPFENEAEDKLASNPFEEEDVKTSTNPFDE